MQAAFLYKEQIKEDIIFLSQEKKQKGSERNILNKWFQDSIKNYFLETYASPFLKNEFGEGSIKKVKQNIEKKMLSTGLKFMNLLNQYKIELETYGKAQKFVNSLISIIIDDQKLEKPSSLWAKQAKKKFVALMLIVLMEYNEGQIQSFYDMWNYIFPSDAQIKKKLTKEDKLRLKNDNSVIGTATTFSPMNSSSTLAFQKFNQIGQNFTVQDNTSQCSRTHEFQEIEIPAIAKNFKIEAKQECYDDQSIQQQQYQQFQQQLQFIPTQQYQQPQIGFKKQEFIIRSHSNSQINQQYNPQFINTPDFIRRMSQVLPFKQEAHEQELINLDDPSLYAERIDETQLQQYQQTPIQFAQQPQLSIEQQLLSLHNQQQIQNQGIYQFQEPLATVHIPAQTQQQTQLPNNSNSNANGYFYNNLDLNNYFNVDQLLVQNNQATANQNIY